METPPYKLCVDASVGRHFVATQTITVGTIILREKPLVRGPFFHTCPVCLGCGKILVINKCQPCSKCGWPVCNEHCENADIHVPECKLTTARGAKMTVKDFGIPNPNYQFISILRALYLKQTAPELWSALMHLQSHSTDVNLAPPGFIKKVFKLDQWSEDEIKKVSEILVVNGHELPVTQSAQLVVYNNGSFFEHSCRANCTKTFTNTGEILIIAGTTVNKGEHLSICYTELFWGTQSRRQHLYQTKRFWCSCPRCQDPTEMNTHINSIKCLSGSCPGLILPKTFLEEEKSWHCNKCSKTFSSEMVKRLLTNIGVELSTMPKGERKACEQFIKKYEQRLSKSHFYLLDVKLALSYMLASENLEGINETDLKSHLNLLEELISTAGIVAPAERRLHGLLLYRIAKTKIEIARRDDDQERFYAELTECKRNLSEARLLLANEPNLQPEGRICVQIGIELKMIDDLLEDKDEKIVQI